MSAKLEELSAELKKFDNLEKIEMRARYQRALGFINDQLDRLEGGKRVGAARGLVMAHGLAVRYYVRFGEQIDAEAFPVVCQSGKGPALRRGGANHFPHIQDFEDDLFEFVVALRRDYRDELLMLLKEGWIRAVLEP